MLKLCDDLSLPDSAVTEVLADLGRRGSGKTYAATKLAEEMHRIRAQFVALDPVGIWYGLRLATDGKSPGLEIPIFGGLNGDLPITPASGVVIADVVVDHNLSAVVDTSQFETDADKNRFVYEFANRFFFRKKSAPSAVHLFIEEAQEFIPQNLQKGEEKMLHAMQRMIRLGRNYGIGVSLISQRPQDVNKKALNQAEVVFAFQLTGPQEIDAVKYWCQDKGFAEDLKSILPKLKTGYAHLWSPVLLQLSREVHIAEKHTFAAGTTPKIGAKPVRTKPLEPIELSALQERLAATIEQQKADDPKELRAQIQKLKREMADLEKRPAAPQLDIKAEIEKAVQSALREQKNFYQGRFAEFTAGVQKLAKETLVVDGFEPSRILIPEPKIQRQASPAPSRIAPRAAPQVHLANGDGELSQADRKILTVLAQYPQGRTRKQIAILTGYSYGSGGFNGSLGTLGRRGYLVSSGGEAVITEEGLKALGHVDPLPTGAELLDMWQRQLDQAESRILSVLADSYPEARSRQELAEETGYSYGSGGFNGAIGKLGKLELIEPAGKGLVRASAALFEQ